MIVCAQCTAYSCFHGYVLLLFIDSHISENSKVKSSYNKSVVDDEEDNA